MKKETNGSIKSNVTAAGLDPEILSSRRLPMKGVDLSTSVHLWIMEKEGALSKSTLESYRKSIPGRVPLYEITPNN